MVAFSFGKGAHEEVDRAKLYEGELGDSSSYD
jgi:hypothetical protein